jgi:acetoin utilization deacetylase AcuC-like enzyme
LNLPLRAATPAVEQKRGFEAALDEMSSRFTPDLIIISAGFDSHIDDPLGQLLLTDKDFISMTKVVKQWAASSCKGRLVSCLEGGYNLDTLGETVRAHVSELRQ